MVLLDLPERVDSDASLALQIYLPFQEGKEPVWVISRVSESGAGEDDSVSRVKAQFVSFLPGGEVTLKTFNDRALRDPTVLEEEDETFSTSVFAELELDAVRSMETDLLPDDAKDTALLPAEGQVDVGETIPKLERQVPRIRFACECAIYTFFRVGTWDVKASAQNAENLLRFLMPTRGRTAFPTS